VEEVQYKAWGETLAQTGSDATWRKYTGQMEAEAGLYFYNARFYDPALSRFAQADTLVPNPGDPLAWDRYAYVNNNPLKYTDPSGRILVDECSNGECPSEADKEKYASASMELRFKLWMTKDGRQWNDAVYGHENPIYSTALFAWSCRGILAGEKYAGLDLALIVGNNASTGLMGLAVGGDVVDAPIIVSGSPTLLSDGRNVLNRRGEPYPSATIQGYGEVPMPDGSYVPNNSATRKTEFTDKFKSQFKKWWTDDQGFPWPEDARIHHIKPLKFGGTNTFENLVPLTSDVHQLFTHWWSGYR